MVLCTRCKKEKNIVQFLSKKEKILKTCEDCRELSYHKSCKHGKRKTLCEICGGASLCECGKEKSNCKICFREPLKIFIRRIIYRAKDKDQKNKRYDENNFIDQDFIQKILEKSKKCFYCEKEMQFIQYNDDMCTIYRKNNEEGFTKDNCVLACRKCNLSKPRPRKFIL